MRSSASFLGASAFVLLLSSAELPAHAAGPWVDRAMTLPRHDWAFNFGLGLAHNGRDNRLFLPGPDVPGPLGPGFNIEGAFGVARAVQLGLRTGVRSGPRARSEEADIYGRPFDTETYGTGTEAIANPEFYVRGGLIEGDVVELGLEGRVMSPFSRGLGLMFGMPIALHIGRVARLDTGVYVPVLFYDPTESLVSFPFHLWFQLSPRFWLGPMVGIRVHTSNNNSRSELPIGFGLGYSVTRSLDFKAQFLFPDANGPTDRWGVGAGIEVRVE
jgi:hypothetical protein